MGKHKNEFTPQEKKNYWMQRIVDKSNSAFKIFYKEMETVTDWAHHAGMDDKERSNLALMMADRFTAVIRRLAPPKEQNAESKESKAKAEKEPNAKAENKKD